MEIKKLPHTGFTLVEMMVVIAIISTLAAISIPVFLTSRINANEASAIASCKAISSACQSYYMNVDPHTYPAQLDDLVAPASDPPYIDTVLAVNRQKQGYRFTYSLNNSESFSLNADPMTVGRTGNRYFFVDETGIIRANTGGSADATSTPIE